MPTIRFQGRDFIANEGETVLETLLRYGVTINHSCRSGICQTCMMRAIKGNPGAQSQQGLKETLASQNFFLACSSKPSGDLEIAKADEFNRRFVTTVASMNRLNETVMRVRLLIPSDFLFRAGQFINLFLDENTSRSYSIASLPQENLIELHIRLFANGHVSSWVFDKLKVGDKVTIGEPQGKCFYTATKSDQSLLMVATGTGLSPIYGILKDAIAQGHTGPIWLYHGTRYRTDLYLRSELQKMAESLPNFNYKACLSRDAIDGCVKGRAADVALAAHANLKNWRVYLCGNPDMVNETKRQAFLAGASFADIYADPFTGAKPAAK